MPPDSEFDRRFASLVADEFPRLFRYLDRLTGDPDLASDLAQEALVRLYRRASMPDAPGAWLATVALNQFRNEAATRNRRRRLLSVHRAAHAHSDEAPAPSTASERGEERRRVRRALDRLSERERSLLLLSAEGYGYRELASIVGVAETSVGTLLARARSAFRREVGDRD